MFNRAVRPLFSRAMRARSFPVMFNFTSLAASPVYSMLFSTHSPTCLALHFSNAFGLGVVVSAGFLVASTNSMLGQPFLSKLFWKRLLPLVSFIAMDTAESRTNGPFLVGRVTVLKPTNFFCSGGL